MAAYRWLPRTIIPNLLGYWYDFKNGVHNVRVFWRVVWNFAGWDWSGLLELMEVAMLDMAEGHQRHSQHIGSERVVRDLRMYALLCRRLREENYYEMAGYEPHMSDDEARRVFRKSEELAKQDEQMLSTMFRHIRTWWA